MEPAAQNSDAHHSGITANLSVKDLKVTTRKKMSKLVVTSIKVVCFWAKIVKVVSHVHASA